MQQRESRERTKSAVGEWIAWHAELIVLGLAGAALFVAWSIFHWGPR